jgi:hypothetical protein
VDHVALQTLHEEMLDDCRDPEKLALLLIYARQVADRLPALVEEFVRQVASEQQIEL